MPLVGSSTAPGLTAAAASSQSPEGVDVTARPSNRQLRSGLSSVSSVRQPSRSASTQQASRPSQSSSMPEASTSVAPTNARPSSSSQSTGLLTAVRPAAAQLRSAEDTGAAGAAV